MALQTLREKWKAFSAWQERPYTVAPMSTEHHACSTCATEFEGNFCPRCGQSAKVGSRMTLWKTLLLFIDVWGVGNRSMFRTLRDLLARPGFLIADYITGRRSAYFPPFKLLFLLTTLSLLVGHGLNLKQYDYEVHDEFNSSVLTEDSIDVTETEIFQSIADAVNATSKFQQAYPALFQIFLLLYTSVFFFMFFKKSRKVGKLHFHEFFIGMVYITDMTTIYSILLMFLGLPPGMQIYTSLLYIVPLKQLSGYGWFRTVGLYCASVATAFLTFAILLILYFTFLFAFLTP